ncbi:shikimate dehydrogenase family protein [Aminipila sp.]|uniref:shikimate dehydrogenase family protein n=1 Tax=Aminipila sp. TaxID=2060095 RepID=UPI00289DEE7D|nr:shikimate dehydrogenase [Aminipila sp.]
MIYGLIGEKLGHSYSKIIHEKLGAYTYDLFPLTEQELDLFLKAREFSGLNVTIPYKQTVIPYCDQVSPLAQEIGAVNTLYFNAKGMLCGTNTDYHGFIYAMEGADISLYNKKVLILGDGATCKTIRKAVLDKGASEVIIASRKVGEPIFENFKTSKNFSPYELINCTTLNYQDLDAQLDAEIVINATPVGMWPNTENRPIDLKKFTNCIGVFDVIYNPYYTKFILQAKELGIPYASGLAMLVAQATEAAGYFTGKKGFETYNTAIMAELKDLFLTDKGDRDKNA